MALVGCVRSLPPATPDAAPPIFSVAKSPVTGVLTDFLTAVDARDFDRALALTSASWRQRYSVEQFAADFASEPLAQERLARVRVALSLPVQVTGAAAAIELGEGRVLRLVLEPDGFRLSALE